MTSELPPVPSSWLGAIQHLSATLNQGAERYKFMFNVLKQGELLGSHDATPEPTGLTHVIGEGPWACFAMSKSSSPLML